MCTRGVCRAEQSLLHCRGSGTVGEVTQTERGAIEWEVADPSSRDQRLGLGVPSMAKPPCSPSSFSALGWRVKAGAAGVSPAGEGVVLEMWLSLCEHICAKGGTP